MNFTTILFLSAFIISVFTPERSPYRRDMSNIVGFEIGAIGVIKGTPCAIKSNKGGMYVIPILSLGVMYFTAKDEIKVIKYRKRGLWLK